MEGEGAILATSQGAVYQNGELLEISADYSERFWPIPHPGQHFRGWSPICKKHYGECGVILPEELWSLDEDGPIRASFADGYDGPLEFVTYEFYWNESTRRVTVPVDSVVIDGLHPLDPGVRVYVASRDLQTIVPAQVQGGDYLFKITDPELGYDDLWVFATARDSEEVIASVVPVFGIAPSATNPTLFPAKSDSPFADELVACVSADDPFALCNFGTLPLLGQEPGTPSVERVLDRTVVSHAWMAERWRAALELMPADILRLMRGVSAVVLSSDVRPSYYSSATAVIHLDAAGLWLTNAEKVTVSTDEDYRADFADPLGFSSAEVFIKGNDLAWPYYSLDDNVERTLKDIVAPLANLLFHELAHANDYAPPAMLPLLTGTDTMIEALEIGYRYAATSQLLVSSPLDSSLMYELGGVMYAGLEADARLRALTAAQVGLEFEQDTANSAYAYAAYVEDTAMLFQEVMMKHHFNVDYLVAFTDAPANRASAGCDDYILRWGQVGRVAESRVSSRAQTVLGALLDDSNPGHYLANLPGVRDLTPGRGVCSTIYSLAGPGAADAPAAGLRRSRPLPGWRRPRPPAVPGKP